MKNILLFLLALPFLVLGQSEKGASPLPTQNSKLNTQRSTRAVVIGISDYDDPAIPDLQYAHKDAEAFAEWLRSPAGGSVPDRNLVLLINEKATIGNIVGALTGLTTDAKEGEQVIIYFSGHGDVEAKLFSQPGYLLCHNSKASVYMAGAFNIRDLQEVVSTLSLQNKARVLLITDACRAGKLAGSAINGAQLTNANLANQFENATKILSCEPNEFSLEGAEWGGGRGLFSFHLVDGLTGLADADHDGLVISREIQRYLQDKVTKEAEPAHQNPMVVGSATERIATVDAPTLQILMQERSGRHLRLTGTDMRGWEDDIVATTDSATQAVYYAYKNALKHGALLDTADGFVSAWTLLPQLLQRESLRDLHGLLRRNLAAVLIDEAQQALNALLSDDPFEVKNWKFNRAKYSRYPLLLERSQELLGKDNFLYPSLHAKQLFFEAYNTMAYSAGWYSLAQDELGRSRADSLKTQTRAKLHEALVFDSNAAYVYYLLGNSWLYTFEEDSIRDCYHRAMELSPGWKLPYTELAWHCMDNNYFQEAGQYLSAGLAHDNNSYVLLEMLAWLYQRTKPADSVEVICRKMRALHPEVPNDYLTLSYTYCFDRKYELSERYAKQVFAMDSAVAKAATTGLLAINYQRTRRFKDALATLQAESASLQQKGEAPPVESLPALYLEYGKYALADSLFRQARSKTTYSYTLAGLDISIGKTQALLGHPDSAAFYLRRGLAWTEIAAFEATPLACAWLGTLSSQAGRIPEAETWFRQAIDFHPELYCFNYKDQYSEARYLYGIFLTDQHRFLEAEAQYRVILDKDPGNPKGCLGLARLRAAEGKTRDALDFLEKALDQYLPIPEPILKEPLFAKLRKTNRFRELMAKHFPETSK